MVCEERGKPRTQATGLKVWRTGSRIRDRVRAARKDE